MEMEKQIVINRTREVSENKIFSKIMKAEISEINKKLILDFDRRCKLKELKQLRRDKYTYTLINIAKKLNKDFDKITKQELEDFILNDMVDRRGKGFSDWTKHDYKVIIKNFWKWLKGNEEEYPIEVKWIKTTIKKDIEVKPEDLLTEEEIIKLINNTYNVRDRAFISLLAESGVRIGELLTLTIGNLVFTEEGCRISVNGKTGKRTIFVMGSVPYLLSWIEMHNFKDNKESPLWIHLNKSGSKIKNICYGYARKMLKETGKRAGIKKRINPHSFRHARASYLANRLTESQLKQYFGWKQSSDMASIYVHLSNKDTEEAIIRANGKEKVVEQKPSKLNPKLCLRCREKNESSLKFCGKCGFPLDTEIANEKLKKEQDDNIVNQIMEKIINKPKVWETIKEAIEQEIKQS